MGSRSGAPPTITEEGAMSGAAATKREDGSPRRAMAEAVAGNATRLRRNCGLEIDMLAVATGLSPEQPLVGIGRRLRGALRRPLAGAASVSTSFHVLRTMDARVVDSGGGFRSRPLSTTVDPREPEVFEVTLSAGSKRPHRARSTPSSTSSSYADRSRCAGRPHGDARAGRRRVLPGRPPARISESGNVDTVRHSTMTYMQAIGGGATGDLR